MNNTEDIMHLLPEDSNEKEIFDSYIINAGGNSLDVIRLALTSWYENNQNNRYGKQCAIMANELTKHINNEKIIH
jgi:hypothetical protein